MAIRSPAASLGPDDAGHGFVASLRRRLRPPRQLKFTREGKYFVAITLGIGFAAINTGNNLLYLLLGMMLSMIVGSGVLSELSLRELEAERRPPDRVFAGQDFLMDIALHNPKMRLSSFSIEVEDLLVGEQPDKRCYFLKIPPGRRQTTRYRQNLARRGLYRFRGFRISTRFPFTFFRKSREVEAPAELLVLPRVFPVTPPQSHTLAQSEHQTSRLDRRGDFFALREYQEGDDPHDIHWRKSARLGRMLVRQLEDQKGRSIAILLDNQGDGNSPSPEEDRQREQAVSLAASLGVHFITRGYTVSLLTRGGGVEPGAGQAHLTRILRALAQVEFCAEAVPFAALGCGPGADCIQVSPGGCSLGPMPSPAVSHPGEPA